MPCNNENFCASYGSALRCGHTLASVNVRPIHFTLAAAALNCGSLALRGIRCLRQKVEKCSTFDGSRKRQPMKFRVCKFSNTDKPISTRIWKCAENGSKPTCVDGRRRVTAPFLNFFDGGNGAEGTDGPTMHFESAPCKVNEIR